MEAQPKLLLLKRQTVAHMGAAKVGLDALAGISISSSLISAISSFRTGTKAEVIIPVVLGILGSLSLLIRVLLAYYMNVAVIKNPINSQSLQVISQPDPIEEKPT